MNVRNIVLSRPTEARVLQERVRAQLIAYDVSQAAIARSLASIVR